MSQLVEGTKTQVGIVGGNGNNARITDKILFCGNLLANPKKFLEITHINYVISPTKF